jgi:hydroxyacylglutathione hydrolase
MPHIIDQVSLVGCGSWHGMKAWSRGSSCNTWLIDGGSELALVDAGEPEAVPDVWANIQALGLDPRKIGKVLLTHCHGDHSAGIAELLRRVDAKVYGHALARETLAGRPGIYKAGFHPPEHVNAPVHELVREGDNIHVGDVELTVLELPGHTPDSLGFALPLSAGMGCFTGDSAIGDQPMHKGVIGWLDYHWSPKLTDFLRTLKRLQAMKLGAIMSGHGNPHLTPESVAVSMANCIAGLERLLAVPELEWLIAIDI